MKLAKLSLAAVLALGFLGAANAADTFGEAFTKGKLAGKIQATYVDQKDERAPIHDEQLTSIQLELGYVTDPFYGFRLGVTGQGNFLPFNSMRKSGTLYDKEWRTQGAVMSEAYLGYGIGQTDIKFGRQYVNTPLVAGNPTRAFKEAFEGLTIVNKDIPNTTLIGGWYYKFQGRSAVVTGGKEGRAPHFKDRVVVGGIGPVAYEFDNIFTGAVINQGIPNLKLTGAYARVTDLRRGALQGDINFYLAEANYKVPVGDFKLGFDAMYKGSRTTRGLEDLNYDGNMIGLRAGIYDFVGFSASYAYTTVGDNDALAFGLGNGPGSYTLLPIRGPFVFTGYAGMNTHKLLFEYDFKDAGAEGLKAKLHLVKGKQDAPHRNAGPTAVNTHMNVKGWAAQASYDIPWVKGLSASVTYTALERKNFDAMGAVKKTDNNELWLQVGYKFNLLN
nr:OprD family outer membrane porin [uncultured Campylobacter sp.]